MTKDSLTLLCFLIKNDLEAIAVPEMVQGKMKRICISRGYQVEFQTKNDLFLSGLMEQNIHFKRETRR